MPLTYVYIIRDKDPFHFFEYKIGISKNCQSRFLDGTTWRDIEIAFYQGFSTRAQAKKVEGELHEYFKSKGKWIRREWFRLFPWDVRFAKRYLKANKKPALRRVVFYLASWAMA